MAATDATMNRREFMVLGSAITAAPFVLTMAASEAAAQGAGKADKPKIYTIEDTCVGCHYCFNECPASAISWGFDKYEQDQTKCIHCGTCASVCNIGAAHAVGE